MQFYSKKALSNIIASVIMILLVVTSIIVVGTFVTNLVQDQIDESGSCFETLDKVLIGDTQTCYDLINRELKIFIEMKDLEINEVLVSVSDNSFAKTFSIKSEPSEIEFINNYSHGTMISLPPQKSGFAYYINTSSAGLSKPTEIQIAPVVGKNTCEVTDKMTAIPLCN